MMAKVTYTKCDRCGINASNGSSRVTTRTEVISLDFPEKELDLCHSTIDNDGMPRPGCYQQFLEWMKNDDATK
jgi:hypothetical protein